MKKIQLLAACVCAFGMTSAFAQDYKHDYKHDKNQHQQRRREGRRQDRRDVQRRDMNHVMITSSRRSSYEGRNRVFHISGNNITVRITGDVRGIIVTGNRNKVTVDDVGYVEIRGSRNTVSYSDGLRREE